MPNSPTNVDAICIVVGQQAHTHIMCNSLTGGRSCINHDKVNAANTCTKNGYHVSPFRNEGHWEAAYAYFGTNGMQKYFQTVGGVYKSTSGGRGDDDNKCVPFANTAPDNCLTGDWQSIDGGDWWITSRSNRAEPSGDYTAYDYLDSRLDYEGSFDGGFAKFNDEGAFQHKSGPFYMCGSPEY